MKKMGILRMIVLALLTVGCSASKQASVANPELETMVQKGSFQIKIQAAEPIVTAAMQQIGNSGLMQPGNNISRIDVSASGHFIRIVGDSVQVNLPYYGERQMGGGYNSDSGITFDSTAADLKTDHDTEKNSYQITFKAASDMESYNFNITLRPNLNASIQVRSSHRNGIRYTGTVREVEATEK